MPELSSFDGCTLFYDDQGDGRPVLLLHGFVGDINIDWVRSGILDLLLDEEYRVVAYDSRGHGLSGKPHETAAYEDDALTKDAQAVLDHLRLDGVVVVGFSMGARTALHLAAIDPRVRGVVALGVGTPAVPLDEADRSGYTSVPDAMLTDDPDAIQGDMARSFREMADAIHADREALAALMAARRTEISSLVGDVTVPVLVITGADDPAGDPVALGSAFPNGRGLQTAGDHAGVKDQPDTHAAIVEFVGSL
ncbi:MAG TPA: alpha/beta hydrolase [Acidimicrobiia bacterium]|jgi:pimeloyl-ACP methyl ester carboxylesterase